MKKISTELGSKELTDYLSNFIDEPIEVEKKYKKTLNAVCDGRLTFSDLVPTYELINPINVGTEYEVKKIDFKTRILPTMTAKLSKGIDLSNEPVKYSLVVTAHIVGFASINELDKLCKKDYELIQELSMVFI